MPVAYQLDLRWRVIWLYVSDHSVHFISQLLQLSESTARRYINMFLQTGEVEVKTHKHGPDKLLGDFEQLVLLGMILDNPGIYLHEIKANFYQMFGVEVSVATICRTLHSMGCTRQVMRRVALQRSDSLRAKFMANISV